MPIDFDFFARPTLGAPITPSSLIRRWSIELLQALGWASRGEFVQAGLVLGMTQVRAYILQSMPADAMTDVERDAYRAVDMCSQAVERALLELETIAKPKPELTHDYMGDG